MQNIQHSRILKWINYYIECDVVPCRFYIDLELYFHNIKLEFVSK